MRTPIVKFAFARGARRQLGVFVIIGCGVAACVGFHLYTGTVLEDALITYRYAENLARGDGFVFNVDERVLGTTTPLLTMILGLVGWLTGASRIAQISTALMIAAFAGAGLFVYWILQRLTAGRTTALVGTALFMFQPSNLLNATGGMETPLVFLLMAASLYAVLARSWPLAATTSALLLLTRIDGLLWVLGILLLLLVFERRNLGRAIALGTGIVAPWLLFSVLYFGSVIPHSVIAKRTIADPVDHYTLEYARWAIPYFAWAAPGYVAFGLILVLFGAIRSPRDGIRGGVTLLLIFFSVLFSVAMYVGRAPFFDHYLAPVGLCSIILGSIGLVAVARAVLDLGGRQGWTGVVARAVVVGAAALLTWQLVQAGLAETRLSRRIQVNETGMRRTIGEWLQRNTPECAVVAMEAIGYQAYYSDRRVIDLAGLVSPDVVRLKRTSAGNAELFHRLLEEQRPDYLVLRSYEVDRNRYYHGGRMFEIREQEERFHRDYRELERFRAPLPELWGTGAEMTIFGPRRQERNCTGR